MTRKKLQKKTKHKPIGVEAIAEPGVGALYVRGTWMKKLNKMGKRTRKIVKQSHGKRKH